MCQSALSSRLVRAGASPFSVRTRDPPRAASGRIVKGVARARPERTWRLAARLRCSRGSGDPLRVRRTHGERVGGERACADRAGGGRACRRQAGGGRSRASGTTGLGAQSRVVISARVSSLRWRAVRTTLASTCWVSAPRRVRLPPHTLRVTTAGRMACSARQLVASMDGSQRKRHAQFGVQFDDQRGHVRTRLDGGRAQRVGSPQGVPALHPPPARRAMTHLDVEAPHQRTHFRQVFLILRRRAGHHDRLAAVRTRRRGRRRVRLVNPRRRPAATLLPILRPGAPAGTPAAALRTALGEGGRLPTPGALRRLELLLQMLVAALPVVPLLDQPRLVSFKTFDAHVPGVPLPSTAVRIAAASLLARHDPRIGTCPPHLHTFIGTFPSRPGNRRQSELLGGRLGSGGGGH